MCRGAPFTAKRLAATVAAVPVPECDPVYGSHGPLKERWGAGGPLLVRVEEEGNLARVMDALRALVMHDHIEGIQALSSHRIQYKIWNL